MGDDVDQAQPTYDFRILVVDDNRDAAQTLAMLLKVMGNQVRTVYDGEEAMAAAREFQPHVVLCDIGLPKLNGYEACHLIKAQAWNKSMILIAVTGWGQVDDRRKSEEAGFDHHLVKPVAPVVYDDVKLECGFRADLVVNGLVLVELKAKSALHPIDHAQTLSHLRLMGLSVGLLINFHEVKLVNRVHRIVNKFQE